MWKYVFVRKTKDKEAQYMLHLLETKRRSTTGGKAAVARCAQLLSGLYLPCSTHSLRTWWVRGERKTRLSWLLGSHRLYTLSPCALTPKTKHITQPCRCGQMFCSHLCLQRYKVCFNSYIHLLLLCSKSPQLWPLMPSMSSQFLWIRIVMWVTEALCSSLTGLKLRCLLGLQSHLRSKSMSLFLTSGELKCSMPGGYKN